MKAIAIFFTLVLASGPVCLEAQSFFQDDFNRPDSPTVGNGWLDSPNNSGGNNLSIRSGQLTPSAIGGYQGIYRPIAFDLPVSVSATLAESSGYGGLRRNYSAEFTIRSDGTLGSGYRLAFSRSDINYNDSLIQVLDGDAVIARFYPSIQFGPVLDLQFTFNADGSVVGTVGQDGQSDSFSFPAHTMQSSGPYFLIAMAGPDGRATTNPTYHRLDNLTISGTPSPAAPPVANAGPDQTVDEGMLVTLDGSASTGQNLTFSWEQLPGGPIVQLSDPTSLTPTFTAPLLSGGFGSQALTFNLTVTSDSQSSSDPVNVTVVNVNHAPVAEAGEDQVVKEGSTVTLSGANSFDPDNDPITCQWIQTFGTPVLLNAENTFFHDDFSRPDSATVGNGWLDSPDNSGGNNLSIQSGQLTPSAIGGSEGIYRPFSFATPVSVSATLAESSGYGGLPRNYAAEFGIRSDGTRFSGYRLSFSRSDINYNDSLIQVLDGDAVISRFYPSIQFGPVLDLRFTFNADGSVVGTVSQDGQSESFSFPAHTIQSTGANFLIVLAGPDGRATTNPTYHRLDNLTISGTPSPSSSCQATFTAPLVPGGVSGTEILRFELTVSDGALSHTDEIQVTVEQENHAPVADAGTPQTVRPGVSVILNGAASSDPDGDPITYRWTQVGGPEVVLSNSTSATPGFTSPPVGSTTQLIFRLTVSDGLLTSAPEDVVVTVINGPPLCGLARPVPETLWPPNHVMREVGISGVTDPDSDAIVIAITSVTQDEPVNGLGDGDTSPDAVIQGNKALLRAERSGTANGRIYQVNFTADDGQGGICTGSVSVGVPLNMKPGMEAVDDGQLYDSMQR